MKPYAVRDFAWLADARARRVAAQGRWATVLGVVCLLATAVGVVP